jgi:hypothetical protein
LHPKNDSGAVDFSCTDGRQGGQPLEEAARAFAKSRPAAVSRQTTACRCSASGCSRCLPVFCSAGRSRSAGYLIARRAYANKLRIPANIMCRTAADTPIPAPQRCTARSSARPAPQGRHPCPRRFGPSACRCQADSRDWRSWAEWPYEAAGW